MAENNQNEPSYLLAQTLKEANVPAKQVDAFLKVISEHSKDVTPDDTHIERIVERVLRGDGHQSYIKELVNNALLKWLFSIISAILLAGLVYYFRSKIFGA